MHVLLEASKITSNMLIAGCSLFELN